MSESPPPASTPAASAPAAASPPSPAARLSPLILGVAVLAGLAGVGERLWLTSVAPRHAYLVDHLDNIQMGGAASYLQDSSVTKEVLDEMEQRRGAPFTAEDLARLQGKGLTREFRLFKVYGTPREKLPIVWADDYRQGRLAVPVAFARTGFRQVNYPPLGETVFWLQTSLLDAVAPGRPVNTFTSRLVMSIASILGEIAAAIGAYLVARRFLSKNLALVAAAVCWLLPPMAMDSSFWGQTDSWFIAPALFTIWLMVRGRWVGAGILSAITVLLKPQGLFLGPIVLFAAAVLPAAGGVPAAIAFFKRAARSLGAGAAALILLVLPWTIADRTAWLDQAYIGNFRLYGETTLKAFNVWYLDALTLDAAPSQDPLSPKATIAGISKGGWGNLLVLAALVALAVLSWKRLRKKSELALLWFSALWLWSTFMWPTKVHERYVLYAIPLVVLCSFPLKRLWPAAVALVLVGSAELCHNVWLTVPPGYRAKLAYMIEDYDSIPPSQLSPRDAEMVRRQRQDCQSMLAAADRDLSTQRPWEYLVLAASLMGYAWAFACPFLEPGRSQAEERPPQAKQAPEPKRR